MEDGNQDVRREKSAPARRSRFYVFSIVALTVFLLCAVVWPLRVQEFRSSSALQMKLDRSLAVDEQKVKSSLVAALSNMTSEDGIETALQTVGKNTSLRSQYLTSPDRESIKDRLSVRIIKSNSPLDVRVAVEFTGDGTPDETEFVNHLTTKLVSEFSRETVRITAAQRQSELKQQLAQIVNDLNPNYQVSLRDLKGRLQEIEKSIESAKALCATETVQAQTKIHESNPTQTIMSRIGELKRERQKLINEQNYSEFHPRITEIRTELEELQTELANFDRGSIQSQENHSSIKNRFTVVSSQKKSTTIDSSGFTRVHDRLNDIDVEQAMRDIEVLKSSLKFSDKQQQRAIAKIDSLSGLNADESSQVTLNDIFLAKNSKPIGGVPGLSQILLLFVSSLLMAAAITAVFKPARAFQVFESTDQVTEQTGLPVIGTVPGQEEVAQKPAEPLAQKAIHGVVRLCEFFLILTALVLVASSVMKTGFFASLIENPFHAAAKLFGG